MPPHVVNVSTLIQHLNPRVSIHEIGCIGIKTMENEKLEVDLNIRDIPVNTSQRPLLMVKLPKQPYKDSSPSIANRSRRLRPKHTRTARFTNHQMIQVLTVNVWNLPLVSKQRRHRLEALQKFLVQYPVDVLCLQEVWVQADWRWLRDQLYGQLPFGYYFRSGIIGSGTAILSRHPIVSVSMKRFSLNGKPQRIFHGDWYGGKGVGLCRIRHPQDGFIDIYNTHLIACYERDADQDEYHPHRLTQLWEMYQFIRHHSPYTPFIVAGDFNMTSETSGVKWWLDQQLCRDSWEDCHQDAVKRKVAQQAVLDELKWCFGANYENRKDLVDKIAQDCLAGWTCQAQSNSWSSVKWTPERLDYLFYSHRRLACKMSRCALIGRTSNNCSFSDHYGVYAEFEVTNNEVNHGHHSGKKLGSEGLSQYAAMLGSSLMSLDDDTRVQPSYNESTRNCLKKLTKAIHVLRKTRFYYFLTSLLFFSGFIVILIVGLISLFYPPIVIPTYGWLLFVIVAYIVSLISIYAFWQYVFIVSDQRNALERLRSEWMIDYLRVHELTEDKEHLQNISGMELPIPALRGTSIDSQPQPASNNSTPPHEMKPFASSVGHERLHKRRASNWVDPGPSDEAVWYAVGAWKMVAGALGIDASHDRAGGSRAPMWQVLAQTSPVAEEREVNVEVEEELDSALEMVPVGASKDRAASVNEKAT